MKAAFITQPGGVEVLEIRDVKDPDTPTADRVQVRIRAAGLNRADLLQRQGKYPPPAGAPKDIPGLEFAGEVAAIGPEVISWRVGDRVFGVTGGGAQAQFLVVPADHLAPIPENLSWSEAAAIPEVFITAHDALFTQAQLKPGETLLIHAVGSGVGTAASQLAQATGVRVFGTSRTEKKLEAAREFGLDESFLVGGNLGEIAAAVLSKTDGKGVNVVLDLVGANYLQSNLEVLAREGRMIFVGTTSGTKAILDYSIVMHKRLMLKGTVLRARSEEEKATATRLFAAHVGPLLARGLVKPVVDRVYPLTEIREAHRRMEEDENFGKIVLEIE